MHNYALTNRSHDGFRPSTARFNLILKRSLNKQV